MTSSTNDILFISTSSHKTYASLKVSFRRVLGVLGSEKSWFFLFLYGRVLVVDYEYDLENFVSSRFFLEIELKKAEKP